MWKYVDSSDPTLENTLFGAVKLVKNLDINKCKYSGYDIGFDMKETFSFPSCGFGKNVVIFKADMSSSVHFDNKKEYILILGECPTQGLDYYSVNFTVTRKECSLSLHYDGENRYLFVNGTKIIKLKAKEPDIVATPLCLWNISKGFLVDDIKNTGFYRYVYDYSVDYDAAPIDDISDIHKYLMKNNSIEQCLDLSKKV